VHLIEDQDQARGLVRRYGVCLQPLSIERTGAKMQVWFSQGRRARPSTSHLT